MVPGQEDLVLEGRQLSRSFGSNETFTLALREVSAQFQRGRLYLIKGPSGSGKSTLLAVLSGLLSPDSGEVVALGQEVWQLSPHARQEFRLRHFSFIFQGYNLFPELTALQQLEIVLRWGERPRVAGRPAARGSDPGRAWSGEQGESSATSAFRR